MKTILTRRLFIAGNLALVLSAGLAGPALRPVLAHEAKCPLCKLDVVQDTDKLDNEVALKSGRKRIEYRCVYCALQDAKSYTGDITILAPSELKGKPVLLARKEGKWSAAPETAVFVGQKVNHRSCQVGYRALTTKDAFDKWVHANHELLKDAKPLTLPEMLAVASPAK
jgi:hypothetical protein